jgi:hypothetical protein
VLAPDLLGIGEMKTGNLHGGGYSINGVDYAAWFESILIGRSVAGVQAGEVVRLARLLHHRAGVKKVDGLARGRMGPVLLHAAAFDASIDRIVLIDPYTSYRSRCDEPFL